MTDPLDNDPVTGDEDASGRVPHAVTVGNWVRRSGRKWHLIESVIADDAVTKCGRRMADPGLMESVVMPLTRMIGQPQLCKRCA